MAHIQQANRLFSGRAQSLGACRVDVVGGGGGGTSGGTAALGWSAPSLTDGATLTITTDGTYSFGTKTNARPMYYWDAGRDNSLNSNAGSRKSFTMSVPSGGLDTSVKPANSIAALRFDYTVEDVLWKTDAGIDPGGAFITDADGAGHAIICMFRRKYGFTATQAYAIDAAWNHKGFRWWSAVGSNNSVTGMGQQSGNQGDPRIAVEYTASTTYVRNIPVSDLTKFGANTDWVTEIIRCSSGTVDGNDAYFKWMCNGETATVSGYSARTAGYPSAYRKLFMPQAENMPTNQGWSSYCDFIYVDDTPHAVLIGDAATWDETGAYQYEPCIPVTWSSTTITCTLRKGSFASYAGKYLYVLNGSGLPIRSTGVAL